MVVCVGGGDLDVPSKMTSYLASSHAQQGSLISSGDAEECSATRRSHSRIDSRPESMAHTELNGNEGRNYNCFFKGQTEYIHDNSYCTV